jgi:acetylornithine deacetylase/succinyl-diaminopimelate desuccinylase-like protein
LAVDLLAQILEENSIPAQRLQSPEGRINLYARVAASTPSSTPAPALVLMHHMDVVPAGPDWTVDAFSGRISDDRIWGRGALDVKSLGIAQLSAFISLTTGTHEVARDVIYLAVADEEKGGTQGAGWILQEFPDLFANVLGVLNEGGGNRKLQSRLIWWGVEVAQKHPLWLEVIARSDDETADAANRKLLSALSRLLGRQVDWRVTEPVRNYMRALAPMSPAHKRFDLEHIDAVIAKGEQSRVLMPGMHTLFLDSVQINVLETVPAGDGEPALARAKIDIRLLPDQDSEKFLEEVKSLLGDDVEVEVLLSASPSPESPATSEVYKLLSSVLSEEAPVVPIFSPGFTDSRYFRQRGIDCYGFSPFAIRGLDVRGIHGPDERIPLREFELGVERLERIVAMWASTPPNVTFASP